MLSANILESIVRAVDDKIVPATRYDYMRAAYNYGRQVKPLLKKSEGDGSFDMGPYLALELPNSKKWIVKLEKAIDGDRSISEYIGTFADEKTAATAIQQHYENLVLGALE